MRTVVIRVIPFLLTASLQLLPTSLKSQDNTDSTTHVITNWKLDEYLNKKETTYDTSWNDFYRVNPIFKKGFAYNYTANIAAPYQHMIFHRRKDPSDYLFLNTFYAYLHQPGEYSYFNARRPFTYITYTTSNFSKSKLEQTLQAIHTQNVTENLNLGFRYNLYSDRGQFKGTQRFDSPQGYRRSRISALSFFSSYEKDAYRIYGNLNLNKIGPYNENGGLANDFMVTDTVVPSEEIEVRLDEAKVDMSNNRLHIRQALNLKNAILGRVISDTAFFDRQSVTLFHTAGYQRNFRLYKDKHPAGAGFYEHNFANNQGSSDSTFFRSLKNELQLEYKYRDTLRTFGTTFGVVFNDQKYAHNKPADTLVYGINDTVPVNGNGSLIWYGEDTIYNTVITKKIQKRYLTGSLTYKTDKMDWSGGFNYFINPYHRHDLMLFMNLGNDVEVFDAPVSLRMNVKLASETVNYLFKRYTSNHFIWDNASFEKEQNIQLSTGMEDTNQTMDFSLHYSGTRNYTYLNTQSMPVQHEGWVGVYSAEIRNHLQFWKIHLNNKLAYQYSSHDKLVQVPDLVFNNTTYFQDVIVEKALQAQLGFNVNYYTSFYGPAYNPSLGMFHLQQERRFGNYPVFDVFVNALWKRTRILLKYEHVNARLDVTGLNDFSALHYPHYFGVFKIAIGWSFYN